MSKNNYVRASLFGFMTAIGMVGGTMSLSECYSKRDSVRDAVYAKAEEITQEIITKADRLADNEGHGEAGLAAFGLGFAGWAGASTLAELRKK